MRDFTKKASSRGARGGALAVSAAVAGLLAGPWAGPAAAATSAAAARGSPVLPSRPGACAPLAGAGPGYNASIGNAQDGQKICISVGEKLLVFLSVPPTSGLKWHPVQAFPTGILAIAPLTLMLSRGVTATNFLAVRTGVAHLSSQRMGCSPPPKSHVACGATVSWTATVVVVGTSKGGRPT